MWCKWGNTIFHYIHCSVLLSNFDILLLIAAPHRPLFYLRCMFSYHVPLLLCPKTITVSFVLVFRCFCSHKIDSLLCCRIERGLRFGYRSAACFLSPECWRAFCPNVRREERWMFSHSQSALKVFFTTSGVRVFKCEEKLSFLFWTYMCIIRDWTYVFTI